MIVDNFTYFSEILFESLCSILTFMQFGTRYFEMWLVILLSFLVWATLLVSLCSELVKKYNLGFIAGYVVAFLVFGLVIGLMGLIISADALLSGYPRVHEPFLVVGVGASLYLVVLGLIFSWGTRLRTSYPKVSLFLLIGVRVSFAWVFFISSVIFFFGVYG